MSYLIFTDIDGTIRDFDGAIPPSTVIAVQQLRQNGHQVCLCTGRPVCQVEPEVLRIGFDGIVASSGAYVDYQNRCVFHKEIPEEVLAEFMPNMLRNNAVLEFQCHEAGYLLASQQEAFLDIGRKIQSQLGEHAKPPAQPPKLVESISQLGKVDKILLLSDRISIVDLKRSWEDRLHVVSLSVLKESCWGCEITARDVHKETGIKAVLKASGNSACQVVAIGDSENDLEMLRFAKIGIAMGNADVKVQRAADMVTAPLRENGFCRAFQTLGLI